MHRRTLTIPVLAALALTGCHRENLSCPVPQLHAMHGDLKENAQSIRGYEDRFATGYTDNSIEEAIASLRIKYPDASKDAIANYLVEGYCPDAVRQAVGVSDQKAKLASFEREVRGLLHD